MKLALLIIMLFSVLSIIIPGIMVKYYKAYWLIAGYNTMSAEKKKNVDVEGLANFVGNVCFLIAAIMLMATLFFVADLEVWGAISLALIIPVSIYLIIKSQKYDGNTRNPDGTMNKKTKLIVGGVSGFLLLTLVGAAALAYVDSQPAQFVIGGGYLEIKGRYGEKINLEEIEGIHLTETMPKIILKNNGYSLGTVKKGNFRLEGIRHAKLFLDTAKPPFIYIERNDRPLFFNAKSREETEELFHALVAEKNF